MSTEPLPEIAHVRQELQNAQGALQHLIRLLSSDPAGNLERLSRAEIALGALKRLEWALDETNGVVPETAAVLPESGRP